MNNPITLTFTIGQLLATVGVICLLICLVVLTAHIVKVLKKVALAADEAAELIQKTHETLDDVRQTTSDTIESITNRFAKIKGALNVLDRFKIKNFKK